MEKFYEAKIFTEDRGLYRMVFSEHQNTSEIFNDAFVAVESVTRDSAYELIPTARITMISVIKLPAGAI